MAECSHCIAGVELMGSIHFEHGDAWSYPCKRGPIERELRAIVPGAACWPKLSPAARDVVHGVVAELNGFERVFFSGEYQEVEGDVLSYAIEAAGALGI